jgi:hypothetical protein
MTSLEATFYNFPPLQSKEMFKNSYQSGKAVELFSLNDKSRVWKVTGRTLPKEYDKSIKSSVLLLEGSNMKLSIPSNDRGSLFCV